MPNRLFFFVVIGAILLVLAIMGVIVLVLGDNEDQGENTGPPGDSQSSFFSYDYLSEA
jgi:hypothetical protein